VELRPESGRGAEDHDDHKKPYGHVDRGVLGVARESRPHCGWICGYVDELGGDSSCLFILERRVKQKASYEHGAVESMRY
jgi:hypothetical protein